MYYYPEVHVKISSALLGSAHLMYAQIKQDGLLLWGPDVDMSEEAGWRPKRIGFYIVGILSAFLFITQGYLRGCIGWTIATVQGPRTTSQEKPAMLDEKAGMEKEENAQTDSNDAAIVTTEPDTEAQSPSSTSAIVKIDDIDSQATECVGKVLASVRKPTGVREGIAYLVLNELMSRALYQLVCESRSMQWIVHLTTSLALAGLRMLWTHAVLTDPSVRLPRPASLASWVRIYQALLLPSLAYAAAQPATVLAVNDATGRFWEIIKDAADKDLGIIAIIALATIMVGLGFFVAAAMVAVCVTPAILTLNRVEILFLPKDIPTIATLYTNEQRGEDKSQYSRGFYGAFLAPSVRAWRDVDRRTFVAQCWLSIKTCTILCVPGNQFLQIMYQSQPAS